MWVNTNVLDRFRDEYKIQLAWLRQAPPDPPNLAWSFTKQLRQMKDLLAAGAAPASCASKVRPPTYGPGR